MKRRLTWSGISPEGSGLNDQSNEGPNENFYGQFFQLGGKWNLGEGG